MNPFTKIIAAVVAAVVIGAPIGAWQTGVIGGGGGPPPPTGSANVWVTAPGDAAGTCARSSTAITYSQAKSPNITCGSDPASGTDPSGCGDVPSNQNWNDAYHVSITGDTIGVEAGNYTNVSITARSNQASPGVTFVPDGIVTIKGPNQFQFAGFCIDNSTPSWITFDGGTSKNFRLGDRTHENHLGLYSASGTNWHIVFTNWIFGFDSFGSGTMVNERGGGYTFSNSQFGPWCCGISSRGSSTPSFIDISSSVGGDTTTITGNTFLGNPHSCSDWDTTDYGACPVTPGGAFDNCDVAFCHGETVHVHDATSSLTFDNNQVYSSNEKGVFMEQQGGSVQTVHMCGNMVARDGNFAGQVLWINGQAGSLKGNFTFCFNSIDSGAIELCAANGFSGATVTMVGNLGGDPGLPTGSCGRGPCTAAGATTTYSHNLWDNLSCDATDGLTAGNYFVSTLFGSAGQADFHLASNASKPNAFVSGTGNCAMASPDLDGNARGTTCDAGADEKP